MALSKKPTSMNNIQPVYDAMLQHTKQYDSGDTDYSVTTLQDPPRIVQLIKRHGHTVPFRVEDWVPSFMGTAIHNYFEAMLKESHPDIYTTEIRLEQILKKRKCSGAFDIMQDDTTLWDIKTTKAYNYVYNDRHHWTCQQNVYRWLIHKHMKKLLKKLYIIFWSWQWDKYTNMQNKGYPKAQIVPISLPVWSLERTWDYMNERMQMMIDTESTPDAQLPYCTADEMWARDDVFAVHLKDRKKALRLCPSNNAAIDWMNTYQQESNCKLANLYIDYRPGYRIRCEEWCGINQHCNQFTEYCSMKK